MHWELCKSKQKNTEPSRTKRQRHNQSIAACHFGVNTINAVKLYKKLKESSHQALINYNVPQQKQDCTALCEDKVVNSHVIFCSDLTHCRYFLIGPTYPMSAGSLNKSSCLSLELFSFCCKIPFEFSFNSEQTLQLGPVALKRGSSSQCQLTSNHTVRT